MPSEGTISKLTIPVRDPSTGTVTNKTYDLPSGGGGGSDTNFVGTTAEWNALSLAQKAKYTTVDLTDDFVGIVVDSEPTANSNNVAQSGGIYAFVNRLLTWASLQNKPFSSVGNGLQVTSNELRANVSIAYTGTASATTIRKQQLSVGSTTFDILGSAYMEQSIVLSTSAAVTVTFTNSAITTSSIIDVYTTKDGLNRESISISNGSCVITFPKQDTATTETVKIFIK